MMMMMIIIIIIIIINVYHIYMFSDEVRHVILTELK